MGLTTADKPGIHRRVQFTPRKSASRRQKSTRLMIIVWAAYLITGIILLLWIVNESRQALARYRQSPQCSTAVFSASPQNCRMIINVRVYGIWISDTPGGGAKGGGHPEKMNFIAGLPNGERRTLSVQINDSGSDAQGELNSFYIAHFFSLEQGTIAQAEYWEGRITDVTIPLPEYPGNLSNEVRPQTFRTVDHPVYFLAETLSKATAILGILLIALILWTAFLLLKRDIRL